jgi:ribosomal subunit interface protein
MSGIGQTMDTHALGGPMQYHFSFKHMESSESLERYAESKLNEKISKFVTKPIEAHIFFSVTKHVHQAHLHLKAGDGFTTDVECECGDMYATIDLMADKLESQLKKHKEKLKNHKISPKTAIRLVEKSTEEPEEDAVDAADIIKYETARRKVAR